MGIGLGYEDSLGRVARVSMVGIARISSVRVRGFFGRKGVDSSGAESGINLEFGQDMDGWTFISFCTELVMIVLLTNYLQMRPI